MDLFQRSYFIILWGLPAGLHCAILFCLQLSSFHRENRRSRHEEAVMTKRVNSKKARRDEKKTLTARKKKLNIAFLFVVFVVISLVGAVIWQPWFKPANYQVFVPAAKQTASATDTLTEAQLWQMVIRKEEAFFEFEKRVRSALDTIPEGIFKESALAPFKMVKTNASENKYRNWQTLRRNQSVLKDSLGQIYTNTAFFYYDFLSASKREEYGAAAIYDALQRLIEIDGETGIFDLLGLHHEVCHVGQDNRVRVKFAGSADLGRYMSWHYKQEGEHRTSRLKLEIELVAEGIELELVNLLAGGYLREVAKLGKRPEPAILASRLGIIKPNKREAYNLVRYSYFAQYFFPEGFQTGRFKKSFILALAEKYEKAGHRIFLFKQGKNLEFQEVSINDLEKLPDLIPIGW